MGSRNRNLSEQRDDFLLETNFDDDGALTRAHFNTGRVPNNNGATAEARPRAYRSNYSIDRYSDAGGFKEGQKNVMVLNAGKAQEHSDQKKNTNSLELTAKKNHLLLRCVTDSKSMLNRTPTIHVAINFILCCCCRCSIHFCCILQLLFVLALCT